MYSDKKQSAILSYFLRGGELTLLDCIKLFGTSEIRRIASRLRDKGYPVHGEYINGNNYKTYRLYGHGAGTHDTTLPEPTRTPVRQSTKLAPQCPTL